MSRIIIVAVVLAILGITGAVAFQQALSETGSQKTVTNESFQPDTSEPVNLSESNDPNRFYFKTDNITVRDENETEMTASDDFEWFVRNGTIRAVSGGDLAGDSEGHISYGYTEVDDEPRQNAELLAQVPRLIGVLLVVFVAVVFGRLIS